MKTKKNLFLTLIACSTVLLSACSEDNGPNTHNGKIPEQVVEAFNSQYPEASNVSWSVENDYAVASFDMPEAKSAEAGKNKAWYQIDNAQWAMSDMDIPYNLLPEAVKTAFEATEYAQAPWRVDNEVDVITRHGYDETIYVIETEKHENGVETEAELYYTVDGILVNLVIDAEKDNDHSDMLPQTKPSDIMAWINRHYPDARIIEIDREDGGIEVDLIHGGLKHEIVFTASQQWLYTKTEYERRHLDMIEQTVLDALKQSEYYSGDHNIDDIDRYETAAGDTFYCFELETRFDDDIEIYISIDGEILSGRPSLGHDSGTAVDEDIASFIAQKYPGAVITGKDHDDGYIEIEIRHDNTEKEVYFNGRHEWIYTKWEISIHRLPQEIKDVIEAAGYSLLQIDDDDIDVIETADKLIYEVEVETHGDDVKLIIENGVIVNVIRD